MIYLGADYAGYKLKEAIKRYLDQKKVEYQDFGTFSNKNKNDFTKFIPPVVKRVKISKSNIGILICGTGQGMVIGANRFKGIRATLIFDAQQARFSKTHDNANVLVLSAWATKPTAARKIIKAWLNTKFKPLTRRVRRFKKVDQWPL